MMEAMSTPEGKRFLHFLNSSSQMRKGRSLMSSMFSQPITSPLAARSLPYRGLTLTTLAASRLTVLAITAPHPSLNALEITFKLVPGGPDPMTKGFGIASPSTTVANVGI